MRLNINLATQRYEDVRQFYVRWTTALAVAVIFTAILAVLTVFDYSSSAQSGKRIRDLRQRIDVLQNERARAEAVENSPDNRDVTDQKNFWNSQIARRSFSWTQLFNDLQRIMPGRAYVLSVKPEITPDNRVKLTLQIAAEQHGNAIDLVKRMESSPRFKQPEITQEAAVKDPKTGANTIKLSIETFYTPASFAGMRATREGM
jgi:Tfp pilus assembly protein PilN